MVIRICDYPDQQGATRDVQRLRSDVSRVLSMDESQVQVRLTEDRFVAVNKLGVAVPIVFDDAGDEARLKALWRKPLEPPSGKAGIAAPLRSPAKPALPPGHPVVSGVSEVLQKGLLNVASQHLKGEPPGPSQVVPVSAELVNSHGVSVTGRAAGEVALDKGFKLDYRGVGLAVKQQWPVGVMAGQMVEHDQQAGHLKYGADVAIGGTRFGLAQKIHIGDRAIAGSSLSLGQAVQVTDAVSCHVGLKQSFDESWKPVQPSLSAGVGLKWDKKVSVSWNNQLSAASFQAPPQFSSLVNLQLSL